MQLPQLYNVVKIAGQIIAILGCLSGISIVIFGFFAFQYGFVAGITPIFGGVMAILFSLASLGMTYGFLAIVKAQIDTRNAMVNYSFKEQ